MTLVLRPYQQKAVEDVRAQYCAGRKAPVLVMPTGAGKTQVAAWIIRSALERGNRTLFCAGRTELLDQTVDKLAGAGVTDVRVIQAARDVGPPSAEVTVASVQTLTTKRWADRLPPAELLILDECFPAGTMVDGRPIESLRTGDLVQSFNETTGETEPRLIRRLFCSQPSTLVTVHLEDGRTVTCTAGHPFFDGNGYTAAINLTKGQHVFGQPKKDTSKLCGVRHIVHGMASSSFTDLLSSVQGDAASRKAKDGNDAMHSMRIGRHVERTSRIGAGAQSSVLLGFLPNRNALPGELGANGEHKSKARQQADDRTQSNAQRGHTREGQRIASRDEPSTSGTRRERNRSISDGSQAHGCSTEWLDVEPCGTDTAAAGGGLSKPLQDRYRVAGSDDRRGGRWPKPLRSVASGAGCEETGITRVARVDRVEIHERRNSDGFGQLCPDDLVYNIEVEGNNNYFVDGILVHNCHHGAAATWANVLNQYPSALRLGLTATPERADGKPLGDLFDCLVTGPSTRELMDLGHLVECIVFPPAGGVRLDKEIALDPVAAYQRHGNGERAIVFCVSRQHAQRTEAEFMAAGIACETIDGTMGRTQRRGILTRFRAGELQVLSSIGVLTEGWDDPGCSVAILARGYGHPGLFIQCAGRILRPAPGKQHARLIDLVGSVFEHGTPDAERTYSLDGKAISNVVREQIRQCKLCGACYRPGVRCPNCGHEAEVLPFAPPAVTGEGLTQLKGPVAPPVKHEHVVLIAAKYYGLCVSCRGPIEPGDRIWWATVAKKARHNECTRRAA